MPYFSPFRRFVSCFSISYVTKQFKSFSQSRVPITPKACISSMRSIVYHPQLVAVYHQTAGRYTLARDEIQPRRGWWYTPHFARWWYTKPAAWINKKRTFGRQKFSFCWWGMVDSDHRSQWQQIYSLPPLAAREIPHMKSALRCGLFWSWWSESNQQPADYKSAALPLSHTSVWRSVLDGLYYITKQSVCQHFFESFFDFSKIFFSNIEKQSFLI